MQTTFSRLLAGPFALLLIVAGFLAAIACQWNGPQSIAVADEVGYVTGGVNLIATGRFTNPFGRPEEWFPPTYPVLIGLLSGAGYWDPFLVARLISVVAGVFSLGLIYSLTARLVSDINVTRSEDRQLPARPTALLAALLLACNPTFQLHANRALSESLALCLTLWAVRFWVVEKNESSLRTQCGAGFAIGLATLTRPECLLVLPLWSLLDIALERSCRKSGIGILPVGTGQIISIHGDRLAAYPTEKTDNLARSWLSIRCAIISGAATLAVLIPYVFYLHQITGEWTISHKGPVNLAAGRAAFHQTPREYINPETLELGYYPVDTACAQELARLEFNARRLISGLFEIYCRAPLGIFVVLLAGIGIALLWKSGQRRWCGIWLATGCYLVVVLRYDAAGAKNLQLILPALSLLASVGVMRLSQLLCDIRRGGQSLILVGRVCLCGILGLILLEGATRYPRWYRNETAVAGASLKAAGQQLREQQAAAGVMYEFGATAGYYSQMTRRYLTPNEWETIIAAINVSEPEHVPVYVTLDATAMRRFPVSVSRYLTEPVPDAEEVVRLNGPEPVVIYRLKRST